jgi:hypothetical protein
MPDLTEVETYDTTVHKIAIGEGVGPAEAGGVSNQAPQSLANRTKWLKKQIENLDAATVKHNLATANSDFLVGTPGAWIKKTLAEVKTILGITFSTSTVIQTIYPVGAIYMSALSTDPGTLFGFGTWTHIGAGRTLIDAGGAYGLGATGGEVNHTLTVNEMPSHTHTVAVGGDPAGGISGVADSTTGSAGLGQAHNNMPPWLAVNIWQRTA